MTGLFRKARTQTHCEGQRQAAAYAELTGQLAAIRANFDFAEDDNTIDALIYEENAVLARLAQLNKTARAAGTRSEPFLQKKSKKIQ